MFLSLFKDRQPALSFTITDVSTHTRGALEKYWTSIAISYMSFSLLVLQWWGDESRSHLQASRSADRLHVPHPREVNRKMSTNSEYAVITYAWLRSLQLEKEREKKNTHLFLLNMLIHVPVLFFFVFLLVYMYLLHCFVTCAMFIMYPNLYSIKSCEFCDIWALSPSVVTRVA